MADPLQPGQDEDVALVIDGQEWRGWTEIAIDRSIDALAGQARLDLTQRWPEIDAPRPIAPGMACQVTIGGELVLTGWVGTVEPGYDAQSHGVTVTVDDLTGDMTEASAIATQYVGLPLSEIVARLAAPFGVGVGVAAPLGEPIVRFTVEDGETVFDTIDRACRLRGVLPITDAAGQIVLSRAGEAGATAAVRGGWAGNVLAARGQFGVRGRHSEYIVKAQRPASDDDEDEVAAAHIVGAALDRDVQRYRPLVIIADEAMDRETAQRRADWERSVRRGRSRRASITVQGWRDADGTLWAVNRRMPYHDNILQVSADLLIVSLRLERSEQGTLAMMDLADPQAYTPEPQGEIEIGWGGAVPPKPVARPR